MGHASLCTKTEPPEPDAPKISTFSDWPFAIGRWQRSHSIDNLPAADNQSTYLGEGAERLWFHSHQEQ